MGSLIGALVSSDEAVREDSAAAIFRRGSELAAPLFRQWLTDPDLALQILARENVPQITVGVAVEPPHFDLIRAANGSARLADVPPDQEAKEFELDFGRGIRLDILTSRDPRGSGAVARYLQKFGEGIQQIELDVRDVDRATELLRSRFAVQPINPMAQAGANGTRVHFFLLPLPSGGKVLIELVQAEG